MGICLFPGGPKHLTTPAIMGGAYSTGPFAGGGGGGGNSGGNQPTGVPGGSMNRIPDGRVGNSNISGHPLIDQNLPWLSLARGGQLPPISSGSTIPMRAQPQLQPQQQQQQGAQPGIEEFIANFSRANPNFLYSCKCIVFL